MTNFCPENEYHHGPDLLSMICSLPKGYGEIAYITDSSFISPQEKTKLTSLKYLIVNALRKEEHPTHFNLKQALELIKELAPENAFLTHISHQMGRHDEVEKELPENVHLAWDGLSFDFNPNQA